MKQEDDKGEKALISTKAPIIEAPARLTEADIKAVADTIKLAEELVMNVLEPGIDWGLHPGTASYALKDPGAAKVLNAFNCYSDPDIIREVADDHEISFVIKTYLRHRMTGSVMGTGIACCSSTETKYRYRWLTAEDLEREGISKEGLKTRKPKHKGDELLYRARNPEWEELKNTILKMTGKRADIDAALSLPGVGTALGKLFGHPVERTYRWFWPLAKRLGFPDEESVHRAIGVASMKDWLAGGKTLDQAIEVLISMPPPEGAPTAITRAAVPPAAALKELPTDQRLIGWNAVKALLKQTEPDEASVIKWFNDHYGMDVVMADFDQGEPPEKFTGLMLSRFHDSLFKYKEDKEQRAKG